MLANNLGSSKLLLELKGDPMTSDDYRQLLATKKCPKCGTQFNSEDMGMYGGAYGWQIDDSSFRYTLWAHCRGCKSQLTFKELGIEQAPPALSQHVH
ncbi:MAG: hypothetical protein A3C70_00255 [Candidatus Zambryskibacteria bacterium RIFCSPHIGHO2_02_FULL_43_14]|uniref:Uncharacterized protein n=1 Tax=Candidatus Zambryskibacteria bacterium RIFCSPHIGHO2_02_FULL_43_14 TaxID=1802748 RepID=A0A1G2TGR4_9BACT|nr:MAG: hypothetical protein A2829_03305 [Candidatus Zambryskibacteria bacterium RIFCSPHIGHO2_01_FULL_43_60]OHA95879.1 MAG: hypothetical protein A3C70_00255 [Candidatus Zambryskibacteria bacterium RIFCSPHIGHO2_02_FULL_43_14]OHB03416.1 MAG: hypothetical protein A3B03_02440 [Candidatus Zambryskibacteria bacterium RIFCSPLOWO2_01_FULL_42_41]